MIWTRPSGTDGDILGTWTFQNFFASLAILTFNSDNTFSVTANCKVARASSSHWQYQGTDYYYADFEVQDQNGQYTSVTVAGNGITNQLSLTYDATNGYWSGSISLGSTLPTLPLTYTFTLDSTTVLTDDIEAFVPLATNLSPSGGQTVSATPTFSWADGGSGYVYWVWVFDSNGNTIWEVNNYLTTTSVVYAGPPLTTGLYYYQVVMVDASLNMSGATESFVVQ